MAVFSKGERRLIKSTGREERTGRGAVNTQKHSSDREVGNRREELGARRKKPVNKRNRSRSSGSDMDQDQHTRRKTRK
jgi:hypothetical protein